MNTQMFEFWRDCRIFCTRYLIYFENIFLLVDTSGGNTNVKTMVNNRICQVNLRLSKLESILAQNKKDSIHRV